MLIVMYFDSNKDSFVVWCEGWGKLKEVVSHSHHPSRPGLRAPTIIIDHWNDDRHSFVLSVAFQCMLAGCHSTTRGRFAITAMPQKLRRDRIATVLLLDHLSSSNDTSYRLTAGILDTAVIPERFQEID